MKLLSCDGRTLLAYDISGPIHRLEASLGPIRLNAWFIVDDKVARDWVRRLAEAQREPPLSVPQEEAS
jgi:hypothetical protein